MRRFVVWGLLVCVGLMGSACGGTFYKSTPPVKNVTMSGGVKTKPDQVAERRIVLARAHTNEKIDVVYFRKGSYDKKAMASIRRLMRDQRTNAEGPIDPELIDFLVDIRTRLSLPPTVVFEILSGYRSRTSNEKLADYTPGVAKESLHIYGWAVDFRVDGVNGGAMGEIAKTMQRGGVSFYPKTNHVHVDLGNIRTWSTKGGATKK